MPWGTVLSLSVRGHRELTDPEDNASPHLIQNAASKAIGSLMAPVLPLSGSQIGSP